MIRLPPSKAHIWAQPGGCSGWAQMVERHKKKNYINSLDRLEGIATHKLLEKFVITLLNGNVVNTAHFKGKKINDIVVNDEMISAAEVCASIIAPVIGLSNIRGIEENIRLSDNTAGIVDYWGYDETENVLTVYDFKYGHRLYEVFENWQLLIYTLSLLIKCREKLSNVETFRLVILQPRGHHFEGICRKWDLNLKQLRKYEGMINIAAKLAIRENAQCSSGSHCTDCIAKHDCHTLNKSVMSAVDYINNIQHETLTPDALSREYNLLVHMQDLIDLRTTGMKQEIESLIRSGKPVPGFYMRETKGNLAWNGSIESVALIGQSIGIDLYKARDLITPTQAKDSGFNKDVLDSITHRPKSGHKLTKTNLTQLQQILSKEK